MFGWWQIINDRDKKYNGNRWLTLVIINTQIALFASQCDYTVNDITSNGKTHITYTAKSFGCICARPVHSSHTTGRRDRIQVDRTTGVYYNIVEWAKMYVRVGRREQNI